MTLLIASLVIFLVAFAVSTGVAFVQICGAIAMSRKRPSRREQPLRETPQPVRLAASAARA
jgi:hypothetical protein